MSLKYTSTAAMIDARLKPLEEQLTNCPFCKERPDIHHHDGDYFIECDNINCHMNLSTMFCSSPEEAVGSWNENLAVFLEPKTEQYDASEMISWSDLKDSIMTDEEVNALISTFYAFIANLNIKDIKFHDYLKDLKSNTAKTPEFKGIFKKIEQVLENSKNFLKRSENSFQPRTNSTL